MKNNLILLIILLSAIVSKSRAEVKLPRIFSNNMVFQRNIETTIWGWADAGEKVEIRFRDKNYKVKADRKGEWSIKLPAEKAGGPYCIEVKASNDIKLENILFGDVWVCSGQSNMNFKTRYASNSYIDLNDARYDNIRLFQIKEDCNHLPKNDLKTGTWLACNSETVAEFSAVAYFFGRDLHEEIDVPIGLIHASWGGSSIQAWMDGESIGKFDKYKNIVNDVKSTANYYEREFDGYKEKGGNLLIKELYKNDPGINENGQTLNKDFFETNDWQPIAVPGYFEDLGLNDYNGTIWYRKEFDLPEYFENQDLVLDLGWIDDYDFTFFNGQKVGSKTYKGSSRKYTIPAGSVKKGKNEIAVCVYDKSWKGGFWGPRRPSISIKNNDALNFDLQSIWEYKPGVTNKKLAVDKIHNNSQPMKRNIPTYLYNAMISPLAKFSIKGAIWYQGESNTGNADEYSKLLPAMIEGWRKKWGQGDFPFLIVQLANYGTPGELPKDESWARLREAQFNTLKVSANTGLAVTLDVGNEMDVHPTNKQEVGKRLMKSALKVAYEMDVVHSGPTYKSHEIKGDKIIVQFDNIGSGLMTTNKFGYVNEFAIAGSDNKYVWAKAFIQNNKVVVYSDKVKKPLTVRYAWSNNPSFVNLYNKEGLPVVPFETKK